MAFGGGWRQVLQKNVVDDGAGLTPAFAPGPKGVVFGLLLLVLGGAAYHFRDHWPLRTASPVAVEAYEKASHVVREGERIRVAPNSPLRAKLAIEPVPHRDIQRTLVLPATVEADPARLMKILPPLAGRIMQLKAQLGERVELGQPLAVLDSSDLGTAYAEYDRAKVLLALAVKNRDRQRELSKIGGGAIREQQQAEADYFTAEVELQRAEARLRQIGVEVETAVKSRVIAIAAPMAGSVIELTAAPGTFWNDTTAALMTVADLSTVWVAANVPEKDTALIAKGQDVTVTFAAYPGEVFSGQVLFVSDVVDPDTRRTKVRIEFRNPGMRLKPNMFANVSFLTPRQAMPVVPTTALVLKNETDQVFVEVEPWVFEERPVEVAFQEGNQAVIKSGLKPGDRVVMRGGILLND